jgi:cell wall assembly regulator SMI1
MDHDHAQDWNAQQAINDLLAELKAKPEENEVSIAEKELERSFPLAVKSLVQIALHSDDEKLRRLASLDLLNLGIKVHEIHKIGDGPLERFLRDVTGNTDDA